MLRQKLPEGTLKSMPALPMAGLVPRRGGKFRGPQRPR
jgi:hypothetical protein